MTAGCIDTDLPAGRRNFGQSDKPLLEIAHAHHAMWVTFTETRCELPRIPIPRTPVNRGGATEQDPAALLRHLTRGEDCASANRW